MSVRRAQGVRAVVIGDLLLDVVVVPPTDADPRADVNGQIIFRQGGSAATTALWLARVGLRTTLITSLGRDAVGRALVAHMESRGVRVRAGRSRTLGTGRMGVLLDRSGERTFVADRRAAIAVEPAAVKPAWFSRAHVVHVPAYSLFGEPLTQATLYAGQLAHEAGALVSVDLASASFIAAGDIKRLRRHVVALKPSVVFATSAEAEAFAGGTGFVELTAVAPLVIIKRGRLGATAHVRGHDSAVDVPTTPVATTDATGAGDAFAAGVLAALSRLPRPVESLGIALVVTAVRAGHRAARRQLIEPRTELRIGS